MKPEIKKWVASSSLDGRAVTQCTQKCVYKKLNERALAAPRNRMGRLSLPALMDGQVGKEIKLINFN